MKSRIVVLVALVGAVQVEPIFAQMLPMSPGANQGMVSQASCNSCCDDGCGAAGGYPGAHGFHGGGHTVWGTQCGIHRGLYPPCPNPCRTTLLAEMCCDIKHCFDHSMSHLCCCLFGTAAIGCGKQDCCCGGCDTGNCCDSGYDMGMSSDMMQMSPGEVIPAPTTAEPNPFTDDPQTPNVQPIPGGSASRNVPLNRRASVAARGTVRPVTHAATTVETSAPQPIPRHSIVAKPIRTVAKRARHYAPRRQSLLRTSRGAELQKTPMRTDGSQPTLRFRESS